MHHFPVLPALLLVSSLVGDAAAQRLIAADTSTRELVQLDLVTGARTPLVSMPPAIGSPAGLAWDAASSTMFVASSSADALFTADLSTGAVTQIGPFGNAALVMHGFELDTSTGQLFGCSSHDNGLYTIDRATGAAALVGLTGLTGITNLAHDPIANVLYATNTHTDGLYTVDRATGAVALVGTLAGPVTPQGLAFDARTGVLHVVDNTSDQLLAVDVRTATAWPVGSTGVGNVLGLAFVAGGTASIVRAPHACGTATVFAHGAPTLGGTVTVHVGATTGVPFVGFGAQPAAIPFCGCTIGHEWTLAFAGATSNVVIPVSATLVGVQIGMQGLDLFGAGGCADPAIVLTDTLVLTIG